MLSFINTARILENVILPIGDRIFGTSVIKELKIQRKYASCSEIELEKVQQEKLHKMLKHATENTSYYKKYKRGDLDLNDWLLSFPILTKKDTVDSTDLLISKINRKANLIKYESSGSSGLRSLVYLDKKEQSIIRAILINWWEWNGYFIGKPLFQTGMSPERGFLKSIKDKLFNTHYFTAFGLDEQAILAALKKVENVKKMHLFGYASSLYEIARVAKKHNLDIQFDKAMSQGDKLFDHYKREIETAFNCDVVEDYGLNEGIMIGQKKDLPYFYVYTPNVFLEIVDDFGKRVEEGTMGRIIATKLDGYAMPLIRYDTGDLGVMLPRNKYPANRDYNFPLLERVIGRNTDIIKTLDGKTLIVHTFTGIFEFFPQIEQFQVVQKTIDSITFRYIPSEQFEENVLQLIENKFRELTECTIGIIWEKVYKIEPSKSGKPQIIINELLKSSQTEIK
jgi:phenylacetate-CoA ligase